MNVRNWDCSSLLYFLNSIDWPSEFDKVVMQNRVKVLIDSRTVLNIIGSTMAWIVFVTISIHYGVSGTLKNLGPK